MLPEDTTPDPQSADQAAESPQSILARRLAEISAQNQDNPPLQAPAPPANPDSPTGEIQERPAMGTAPLLPGPVGAGTAEHEPGAEAEARPTFVEPIAAAGSEPQRRAEEHAGDQNKEALAETAAPDATAPAEVAAPTEPAAAAGAPTAETAAGQEEASAGSPAEDTPHPSVQELLPEVDLPSAQAIEQAPEGVAVLPTSATEAEDEAATAMAEGEDATTTVEAAAPEEAETKAAGPDFDALSVEEQATFLLGQLRGPGARKNRRRIFDFGRQYETAVATARTEARQQFTQAGGAADDFAYQEPAGYAEVSKALQEFRESRARDARTEDADRARNLTHKQHLLAQLRLLVESAETKDSSARLKVLQNEWKAIGPVPQPESQELWNSYHALLDIYYNNRGLFFEMKELDRRRNQEAKEALITRAEALSGQPNVNKALQELRQLHEEWKHIGPVPNEQREPLWARLLAASAQVHARKQELLDARGAQESANLTRKTALLEQVAAFADFQTERVNEWRGKTDELQKLKEEWDAAGLVPRAQAEAINKQFWTAYKGFFQRKNQFFKALDEEKNANLKLKQQLVEQAEAALQNPDWEAGREIVIRLQKEWKLIGRVPEKQSDKIWHRFRTTCDAFFERKHEQTRQRQQQVQQVSQEQTAYLNKVEEEVALLTPDSPGTPEGFRQYVADWRTQAGSGGRSEEKFQALMGRYLDAVPGVSYEERAGLLFQLQVERLKASPDAQQALYKQEQALRREISESENDISTLQTNLDFFGRSKNADQLRAEYQGRIDEAQKHIEQLKKQLKIVRS